MSVINQMLKDLEQRQAQSRTDDSQPVWHNNPTKSNTKVIVITLAVVLFLNVIAFFAWQLYQENNQLKNTLQTQQINTSVERKTAAVVPNNTQPITVQTQEIQAQKVIVAQPKSANQADKVNEQILAQEKNTKITDELVAVKDAPEQKAIEQVVVASEVVTQAPVVQTSLAQTNVKQPTIEQQTKTPVTVQVANNTQNSRQQLAADQAPRQNIINNGQENTASMSVSRTQLSPSALAKQHMAKAERALADNNIPAAEKLFEEVLLLTPENKAARQQLTALWYGRKAYQPALNLLQQGLNIDPQENDFRLMQARIYLVLGRTEQAYNTLSMLAETPSIEYQSLLANSAQQLGKFEQAIQAYQTLVTLAPQEGRWWLGLAVAFDSNKQYRDALEAYRTAIVQGDVSANAIEFAKNRIDELGE